MGVRQGSGFTNRTCCQNKQKILAFTRKVWESMGVSGINPSPWEFNTAAITSFRENYCALRKLTILILSNLCVPLLLFSQSKDYLDVSKVMTQIELSFSTNLSFYHSNNLHRPSEYKLFVSPEYLFQTSFDFKVAPSIFIDPVIGLSYSVRRTPFDEGVRTTTAGIEHVSYYLKAQTLNLNIGAQGEWYFLKRQKDSWSVKLLTMYSRTVFEEQGASINVDSYPTFTGRLKELLIGNLSMGYTFVLPGLLDIQLLAGCAYQIGFRGILDSEHIAKVFPVSPLIGVSFVFDTEPKESIK